MTDSIALSDSTSQRESLLGMINASWTTQVAAAAVELGLADVLTRGPCGLSALARACGCHAPSLHRLMRAMASLGLCIERDDGTFVLTPMGELLGTNAPQSLSAWALICGRNSWSLWGGLVQSVRTGESARKQTLGIDDFGHLQRDRGAAAVFHQAMVNLTQPIAAAVARVVDFSGDRMFVDVGGGFGELAATILATHPALRGVVFDLAHATSGAPSHLAGAGVADRCRIEAGSFFDGVPSGADTYLLKSVLHNWDDERCLTILRHCRRALPVHGRLLVIERLAPERAMERTDDQIVARSDLNMLVSCAGRERTRGQYEVLLAAAGLQSTRDSPLGAGFSVIEVVRQ